MGVNSCIAFQCDSEIKCPAGMGGRPEGYMNSETRRPS